MSSTRRVNKRARLARRAENDQMRTARRDSLAVLLSRAQRSIPLTVDEAALLRAAVEAEIREGDAARTSERGQQRAMDQQRQRVDAAEVAIVETEQRAERAEHQVSLLHAVDEGRAHGARRIIDERNEWQQRAAQAEEIARDAHQCSNDAEKHRAEVVQAHAEAVQRLAAQHGTHETRRRLFAAALGVDADTTWPRLLDITRTAAHLAQRAEQERTTTVEALDASQATLTRYRERAEEAIRRADRFEAAWKSARQRAQKATRRADYADAVTAETKRLKERRTTTLRERAERAEHRAGRYRLAWHAARRDRKADRAAMAADLPDVQAADRIRRYVEAVYSADISEGVRDDLRRLLDGQPPEYGAPRNPGPEVITDRATIRDTLAEPDDQPAPPMPRVRVTCAVLHTDAEGRIVPCPDETAQEPTR